MHNGCDGKVWAAERGQGGFAQRADLLRRGQNMREQRKKRGHLRHLQRVDIVRVVRVRRFSPFLLNLMLSVTMSSSAWSS